MDGEHQYLYHLEDTEGHEKDYWSYEHLQQDDDDTVSAVIPLQY